MTTQSSKETIGVRPYARLLTMLGEQLIRNDRVALVELIKNSYDADAQSVVVDFLGFDPKLTATPSSYISITDDGEGMTDHTIRHHWLNPATPVKRDQKRRTPRTDSGRIVQGEKGIGRFAMFKLGSTVEITTRPLGGATEFVVTFDLSFLDEEPDSDVHSTSPSISPDYPPDPARVDATPSAVAGEESVPPSPLFIDEIQVTLEEREPVVFAGVTRGSTSSHGTQVKVSQLRSRWGSAAVKSAYDDVALMQPLVPQTVGDSITQPSIPESDQFTVDFRREGRTLGLQATHSLELQDLLQKRSVLRVSGSFSSDEELFVLDVNGHLSTVGLADPLLTGLRAFREYFLKLDRPTSRIECGPFDFSFYVFDLRSAAPVEFRLDRDEKELIRAHRIYLYRDGVRVLPYGDPEDDWLQLDVIRGTQAAGRILSNDQTVGFVYISQRLNPDLKDKTNREGLLDSGAAVEDFVALLQVLLSFVRREYFGPYLAKLAQQSEAERRRQHQVENELANLSNWPEIDDDLRQSIAELAAAYTSEKQHLTLRAERTEDLAGVGLSVEAASHDIIASAAGALKTARAIERSVQAFYPDDLVLVRNCSSVVELMSFVVSRLEDVQGLFVSTRRGRRQLAVRDYVTRALRMYRPMLEELGVKVDVRRTGPELRVVTTDAALLQVFVNLVDNSVYWLRAARTSAPRITVEIDGVSGRVVFADNGPGVREGDAPFIFDPFYSGKGEEGKGLGLYIARQVAARNGFQIDLVLGDDSRIDSGANFILAFQRSEEG